MRFLIDECTGPMVVEWLRTVGHDVASIDEESPGIDDIEILSRAHAASRILVTDDLDFGELAVRLGAAHVGIILLRLRVPGPAAKIRALQQLLHDHANEISGRFVVVTESLTRISAP